MRCRAIYYYLYKIFEVSIIMKAVDQLDRIWEYPILYSTFFTSLTQDILLPLCICYSINEIFLVISGIQTGEFIIEPAQETLSSEIRGEEKARSVR